MYRLDGHPLERKYSLTYRFIPKLSLAKISNGCQSAYFHAQKSMVFSQIKLDNYTLNVDSTVITRYGNQQGAKRG